MIDMIDDRRQIIELESIMCYSYKNVTISKELSSHSNACWGSEIAPMPKEHGKISSLVIALNGSVLVHRSRKS